MAKKKIEDTNKYTVECKLFGGMCRSGKNNVLSVKVEPGSNYKDLLIKYLRYSPHHLKYFTIVMDGETVKDFSEKLKDNSKLTILLPVGGG